MIIIIYNHYGADGAASQAIDPIEREIAVLGSLSWFYAESRFGGVEQSLCTPHLAGGSHADRYPMAAYWSEANGFVKAGHPEYLAHRDSNPLGKMPNDIFGEPVQLAIQIQEQLDQGSFHTIISFNDIFQ